jgi:mono/diheme cytochrome c family protein
MLGGGSTISALRAAEAALASYGHRNPHGLDSKPGSGALFASEHGPDHGDEINLVLKGENYGWPIIHHRLSREGLRSPMLEFTPAIAPPEGTPRVDYDLILRLLPQTAPSTGIALAADWQGPRPQEPAFDPATTNASQIITLYCAACHGPGLRGGMQRGLLYDNRQFANDDEGTRRVINGGLAEKGMPGFGAALKPDQITALIQYIRERQSATPEPARQSFPNVPSTNSHKWK